MQHLKVGALRTGVCSSRCITTSCPVLDKSHYEVLGIARNATMAEIKAAYYKKSKECHPDLHTGVDAAGQFRAITEAYEVLGNVSTKRLYDKGAVSRDFGIPDTPEVKFHKSRKNIVPAEGSTRYYNFDAWTQAHYSHNFKKSRHIKNMQMRKASSDSMGVYTGYIEKIFGVCLTLAVIVLMAKISEKKIDENNLETKED